MKPFLDDIEPVLEDFWVNGRGGIPFAAKAAVLVFEIERHGRV